MQLWLCCAYDDISGNCTLIEWKQMVPFPWCQRNETVHAVNSTQDISNDEEVLPRSLSLQLGFVKSDTVMHATDEIICNLINHFIHW